MRKSGVGKRLSVFGSPKLETDQLDVYPANKIYSGWLHKKARERSLIAGRGWHYRYFILGEAANTEARVATSGDVESIPGAYFIWFYNDEELSILRGVIQLTPEGSVLPLRTEEDLLQAGMAGKTKHLDSFLFMLSLGESAPEPDIVLQTSNASELANWDSYLNICFEQLKRIKAGSESAILPMAPAMQEEALAEGLLLKRAVKSGRNFKTRYFMLFPDARLMYYTPKDSKAKGDVRHGEMKGVMQLTADFFCSDWNGKKYGFTVSDLQTTFYLSAQSAEEKLFWVGTITGVIRNLIFREEAMTDHFLEPQEAQTERTRNLSVSAKNWDATSEKEEDTTSAAELKSVFEGAVAVGAEQSRKTFSKEGGAPFIPPPPIDQGPRSVSQSEAQHTYVRRLTEHQAAQEALDAAKKVEEEAMQAAKEFEKEEMDQAEMGGTPAEGEKPAESEKPPPPPSKEASPTPSKKPPPPTPMTKSEQVRAALMARNEMNKTAKEKKAAELKERTQLARIEREAREAAARQAAEEEFKARQAKIEAEKAVMEAGEARLKAANATPQEEQPPSPPVKKLNAKALSSMFDNQQKVADAEQKYNPFSSHFTGERAVGGKGEYGKPVPGSKTEERAKAAAQWVTDEIEKLLGVIQKVGTKQDDGSYLVTFGVMFTTYEDISDALVGIMMRAKKRGKIMYEGDMLFQRIHDDVKITMPAPTA